MPSDGTHGPHGFHPFSPAVLGLNLNTAFPLGELKIAQASCKTPRDVLDGWLYKTAALKKMDLPNKAFKESNPQHNIKSTSGWDAVHLFAFRVIPLLNQSLNVVIPPFTFPADKVQRNKIGQFFNGSTE